MKAPRYDLKPGQRGTYAGFEATVLRHYAEGMYEIRVPGGVTCVSGAHFKPNTTNAPARKNGGQ